MDDKPIAVFNAYNQDDIALYSHAVGFSCLIYDIKNELRSWVKYGHTFKTADEALEKIRNEIFDLEVQYHLPQD